MDDDSLHDRIADQFSYRSDRADVWRALDLVLDTDAFLNLGYSARGQPHVLGSSQRRLVQVVGSTVAAELPDTSGVRLLDLGCGRGGPGIYLAERYGFEVVGVDLVPYNVARARANAAQVDADVEFVVGDATRLPIAPGSCGVCTSIDAVVYLPDERTVFSEIHAALGTEGIAVLSDLVMRPGVSERDRNVVDDFADAWDMPPLVTVDEYRRHLDDAGFDVRAVVDVTPHSVGRFRKWTTAYLKLAGSPLRGPLVRLLDANDLDADVMTDQIRRAHDALPHLRHVVVTAVARELSAST